MDIVSFHLLSLLSGSVFPLELKPTSFNPANALQSLYASPSQESWDMSSSDGFSFLSHRTKSPSQGMKRTQKLPGMPY